MAADGKFIIGGGTINQATGALVANAAGGVSPVDPLQLREQCLANGLPIKPWWGKCNSLTMPLGPEPGIACFLLPFGPLVSNLVDYYRQTASSTGQNYQILTISVVGASGDIRHSTYWVVDNVRCVTPGLLRDRSSVYMVTLRDNRAMFSSGGPYGWFGESPVGVNEGGGSGRTRVNLYGAFNIPRWRMHANATGASTWYVNNTTDPNSSMAVTFDESTATQTPWTWIKMLRKMEAHLMFGVYPESNFVLPYSPPSTPMDFDFSSTSAYMAVAAALDRLGLAMRFGVFSQASDVSTSYPKSSLVEIGKDDGVLSKALNEIKDYLLLDYDPLDFGNYKYTQFRRKIIPYDAPISSSAVSTTTTWSNPFVGYVYPSTFDTAEPQRMEGVYATGAAGTRTGGYRLRHVDHDVPAVFNKFVDIFTDAYKGPISYSDDVAWIAEHLRTYQQSILGGREINRVYSGFHTADKFLPGAMLKIIKWSDLGDGPKTHFYAGDKYLPPHAIYHMVNPHRYHRYDDIERFRHIENVNLVEL